MGAIFYLGPPEVQQQLRAFLGMTNFWDIRKPYFGEIDKPLYEATQRLETQPLE